MKNQAKDQKKKTESKKKTVQLTGDKKLGGPNRPAE
ncbi:hypothetical protein JOC54_003485 [Alkalihalobacillus xiaoxiensis]|uniref:Spore protein n=1 Tax=Shouchella xiaoxiensis TaxID=766895 RepID=A0ABS2SXE7_9BACI|nr:spore protein [Shouchella xiaoxiensis]MBM7840205.1 hypothetical protein [Shouchella xiaoxiensis]